MELGAEIGMKIRERDSNSSDSKVCPQTRKFSFLVVWSAKLIPISVFIPLICVKTDTLS